MGSAPAWEPARCDAEDRFGHPQRNAAIGGVPASAAQRHAAALHARRPPCGRARRRVPPAGPTGRAASGGRARPVAAAGPRPPRPASPPPAWRSRPARSRRAGRRTGAGGLRSESGRPNRSLLSKKEEAQNQNQRHFFQEGRGRFPSSAMVCRF